MSKKQNKISDEQQSFLDHIALDPKDETRRLVYSDWLEEHDQLEEANKQRSEAWLREFAKNSESFGKRHVKGMRDYPDIYTAEYYPADYDPDKEEKDTPGNFYHTYHQLIYFLKAHLDPGKTLPFDTPYSFNEYSDELWHHFEVVTGLTSPQNENRHKRPPFHCAC